MGSSHCGSGNRLSALGESDRRSMLRLPAAIGHPIHGLAAQGTAAQALQLWLRRPEARESAPGVGRVEVAKAVENAFDDDLAAEHALIVGDQGTRKLRIGVDLEDLDAPIRNTIVDPSEIDLGKVEYLQQLLGVRIFHDIGPLL